MLKERRQVDKELDDLGRRVLLAAADNPVETEAAASAPFLFTRVRAAIADEQSRRDEAGGWLSMLLVARRAVPAMALIAILSAILTVWSAQLSAPTSAGFDEEALIGTPSAGVEQTVLADKNGLSSDDVFNIVVDRNYGRSVR